MMEEMVQGLFMFELSGFSFVTKASRTPPNVVWTAPVVVGKRGRVTPAPPESVEPVT